MSNTIATPSTRFESLPGPSDADDRAIHPPEDERPDRRGRLEPGSIGTMALVHLMGLAGLIYMIFNFRWQTLVFAVVYYFATGMAITGGYHRLFAHRSYQARLPVRFGFVMLGSGAFQNSVLVWCNDHRVHHGDTDGNTDPYSVKDGKWWAHMSWLFWQRPGVSDRPRQTQDLERSALIRAQNQYYVVFAIFMGFVFPTLVAWTWGDPWGGLLVAGGLRGALLLQATFCVNSMAHLVGNRPYDAESTAADSWLTAFITFGEGFHNYHHKFQSDFRAAIHWWQYDPTKWLILSCERVGLASNLRRTNPATIADAKALAAQYSSR